MNKPAGGVGVMKRQVNNREQKGSFPLCASECDEAHVRLIVSGAKVVINHDEWSV
jgi:hypothetical protein